MAWLVVGCITINVPALYPHYLFCGNKLRLPFDVPHLSTAICLRYLRTLMPVGIKHIELEFFHHAFGGLPQGCFSSVTPSIFPSPGHGYWRWGE